MGVWIILETVLSESEKDCQLEKPPTDGILYMWYDIDV